MAWTWRLLDGAGSEVTGPDHPHLAFPSQADAETWLGEAWRELRDQGVAAVVLLEEEREVYGPMPLADATW